MINLSLAEFLKNKEKYKEFDPMNITIRLKKSRQPLSFKSMYLPKDIQEGSNVYPTYLTTDLLKKNCADRYGPTPIERFDVEIDDIVDQVMKSKGNPTTINKNQYINLDEYIIMNSQHWLNRAVLEYYKSQTQVDGDSARIIFTSDIVKTKKIFKALCSTDGQPIDYGRKVLQLFQMTGFNESGFKHFLLNQFKG